MLKISTRTDTALVSKLNLSTTNLQDTLILHTARGKDHFIMVSALYGACLITFLAASPLIVQQCTVRTDLLCYQSQHPRATSVPYTCP